MAAQDIVNAYQAKLGRAPDARELESELENDAKYGHAQLLKNLDERAAPTFSGGGRGGDADTNNDGRADAGWIQATPGRGRSWVRPGEVGAPRSLSDLLRPMPGPAPGQWNGEYATGPGPRIDNGPIAMGIGPDGQPVFSTMPVQRRDTLASLLLYGA